MKEKPHDRHADHELAIERHFDVPPEALWTAWTDHLTEWWCPKPWTTEIVENDMRPGGAASFIMRGPGGETNDMPGVYLEVSEPNRIVFTNAFLKGWVPQKPFMVGIFEFTADGAGGTHYRASARHWDAETASQHEAMGFHDGWGAVADQLLAVARPRCRKMNRRGGIQKEEEDDRNPDPRKATRRSRQASRSQRE